MHGGRKLVLRRLWGKITLSWTFFGSRGDYGLRNSSLISPVGRLKADVHARKAKIEPNKT